jgi:N-acetylglucosaminyl-diphospho-decaprenol L-rhamnosyltransferase
VIAVSLVSHGHAQMLQKLVDSVLAFPEVTRVILTFNIPEQEPVFTDSRVEVIRNGVKKGYGANNNAAFSKCKEPYFCVLNPDVVFKNNPFPGLMEEMQRQQAAIAAPMVVNEWGEVEDNIRRFPTFLSLVKKAFNLDDGRIPFKASDPPLFVDWVAGMFMLFSSNAFKVLKGFDEKYFMYYEDVDICARAWRLGQKVIACPSLSVVHAGARKSRDNLQHTVWHGRSLLRYLDAYKTLV